MAIFFAEHKGEHDVRTHQSGYQECPGSSFLSLSEFKGHRLIDIRSPRAGDQEGDWVPTRKGVSLAVGLYPAFKQALAQLEAALVQQVSWTRRLEAAD